MHLSFHGTTGAVTTQENSNVSLSISAGDASMLVDTSGDPLQQLLKAGIQPLDLDAVVLTHAHPDHVYAFPALLHNLWLLKRTKPLRILTNPHTETIARQLCDVFGLLTKEGLFPIQWHILEEGTVELLPDVTITLFPVKHSIVASGVKVATPESSLVYSCDTTPCDNVIRAARGATALIHEATGSAQREQQLNTDGHSSARQAGQIAQQAGVTTLYLCHFDARLNVPPTELQREAQEAFHGQVVVPEPFAVYAV